MEAIDYTSYKIYIISFLRYVIIDISILTTRYKNWLQNIFVKKVFLNF